MRRRTRRNTNNTDKKKIHFKRTKLGYKNMRKRWTKSIIFSAIVLFVIWHFRGITVNRILTGIFSFGASISSAPVGTIVLGAVFIALILLFLYFFF